MPQLPGLRICEQALSEPRFLFLLRGSHSNACLLGCIVWRVESPMLYQTLYHVVIHEVTCRVTNVVSRSDLQRMPVGVTRAWDCLSPEVLGQSPSVHACRSPAQTLALVSSPHYWSASIPRGTQHTFQSSRTQGFFCIFFFPPA